MTRLAFIEFADEIDGLAAALAAEGAGLADVTVVAVEPRARLALRRRGIEADSTLPYLYNEAHARIVRASEDLMRLTRERMAGFTDDRGVTVAYATELCHHSRMLANHLLKAIEVVDAASRAHPGATLYAPEGAGCGPGPLIDDTERYLGRVVRRYAEDRELAFVDTGGVVAVGGRSEDRAPDARLPERAWAELLTGLLRRRDVIMVPRTSGYLAPLMRRLSREMPRTVVLGVDYEGTLGKAVGGTLLSLPGRGGPPPTLAVSWLGRRATEAEREALAAAVRSVYADPDAPGLSHFGVPFADLLTAKAESAFLPLLRRMLDDSAGLAELYGRVPRSFLLSAIALGRMSVAGELAKRLGRRSLFVSHGSHPIPVDEVHEIELTNLSRGFMLSEFTHAALATPVQEAHLAYFRQRYPWVRAEGLKTGPLVFARTDAGDRPAAKRSMGLPSDAFVVTHAVTVKGRAAERFHFLETVDEFVDSVAGLAEAVAELDGAHLVVRVHPGFALSDDELRALLPESDRFTISSSGPFEDVLRATDLLVSYSSTAIDEALLNRVPVVLWDKWARYDHFSTPAFDGSGEGCWPVCYVDSGDRLAEALAWVRARLGSGGPPTEADIAPYDLGEPDFGALVAFARDSFEEGAAQ